jgi:hypothetical protein
MLLPSFPPRVVGNDAGTVEAYCALLLLLRVVFEDGGGGAEESTAADRALGHAEEHHRHGGGSKSLASPRGHYWFLGLWLY